MGNLAALLMPAYFASLSSFYLTFYGLQKFQLGDFWPVCFDFFFSNNKCTNLRLRFQSIEQIMEVYPSQAAIL